MCFRLPLPCIIFIDYLAWLYDVLVWRAQGFPLTISKSWKMLMNNKFNAQSLNRNPTGNSRCHDLASRALNMSGYFDQSARSIESRCVVRHLTGSTGCYNFIQIRTPRTLSWRNIASLIRSSAEHFKTIDLRNILFIKSSLFPLV